MKLYFNKDLVKPTSELVLLCPLVKHLFEKEPRFKKVLESGEMYVSYSSIEDCDYVVLPYKWDSGNPNNKKIFEEAEKYNKKVLIFFIDDSDEPIEVENSYVYRTSFYKSTKKTYEKSFPCFKEDSFEFNYIEKPELSVGFCGQIVTPLRKTVVEILSNSDVKCDFLIRNVAWPAIEYNKTKEQVIQEFYKNMNSNIFNLCIRGGGNFSYRLYETLMMGRIPVIVNTDISLPYEENIDWSNYAVIVNDVNNIVSDIKNFFLKKDLIETQKNNRIFWEEYLSPLGVIKNFEKL